MRASTIPLVSQDRPEESVLSTETSVWEYYRRLGRVKLFVEAHLSERISLESAAAVAALDPTYFSKYFHSKVGLTFSVWLRVKRVRRAAELLRTNEHSVTEVAFAVGFRDIRSFQRAFKRFVGKTPSAFKHETVLEPAAAVVWRPGEQEARK